MEQYKDISIKTKKHLDAGYGQWIITINGNDWANILKKAEKSVIDQLEVPGFRKGKVPANLAAKHVTETAVLKNAGNKAMKIAYQYGLDQKNLDVQVTNQPEINIQALSKDKVELAFNFDLPLQVSLKQYRDLAVKKPEVKVTKSEIAEQVKLLKDRFAVYSPKEKGSLAKGDVAVFDFTGTIDGKEFPGNNAKDFELEIGSNRFIPGFEDQMVGMKPGDHKVVQVTFPDNYHVENLISKPAEFSVNLKEIKTKIVNDNEAELVKDVNIPEVKTYDDLINHIELQLTNQKTKELREEFMNQVFAEIIKASTIVIPRTAIISETDRLMNEFKDQLKQQNVSLEVYKEMTGLSDQDINHEAQKDALWKLQTFVIIEEVIKAEKIEVSEIEIDDYLLGIAAQFNMSLEQIKKTLKDLSFVSQNIKRNKALELLWATNGQTATGAKPATKGKKTAKSEA